VDNRGKILEALRSGGAVGYALLRERSGVPEGSYDRTLSALVGDGTITKNDGTYGLADANGDGSGAADGDDGGFDPATYRGFGAYCAACGGNHPKHRNGEWPSFDEACRLGIVA
jgi:hypothetical protein